MSDESPPDKTVAQQLADIQEQVRDAKRLAETAEKEAASANEAADKSERQVAAARKEALNAREDALTANAALDEVRKENQQAQSKLAEESRREDESKLEQQARTDLRSYVATVLSEIGAGVDDAAIHATSRDLMENTSKGGMISPSRIGMVPGRNAEATVDFDLAIVFKQAVTETKDGQTRVAARAGINVLGLGASLSGSWSKTTEKQQSVDQHNRIRFSVPVVFASQRES